MTELINRHYGLLIYVFKRLCSKILLSRSEIDIFKNLVLIYRGLYRVAVMVL